MKIKIVRDKNGKLFGIGVEEIQQDLSSKLIETEIKLEITEKNRRKPLSKNERDLQRDLYYLSRRHG